MMLQTALPFETNPDYSREHFVLSEANQSALAWIDAWPDWSMLLLYGPAGAGKTHLAHIWAQRANARFLNIGRIGKDRSDTLTHGRRAVVLDGLEQLTDETGLFHLINHLREQNGSLLIVSALPPAQLPLTLPDLRSRLQALPAVVITPPDDALIETLLFKLFNDRQLVVSADVIDYLLPRATRSFDALNALVDRIDREALRQRKNITVPFVRHVMEQA